MDEPEPRESSVVDAAVHTDDHTGTARPCARDCMGAGYDANAAFATRIDGAAVSVVLSATQLVLTHAQT